MRTMGFNTIALPQLWAASRRRWVGEQGRCYVPAHHSYGLPSCDGAVISNLAIGGYGDGDSTFDA